jgi:hypothetical protein
VVVIGDPLVSPVAENARHWLVQGLRSGDPARLVDVFRFFAQVRMRVASGATGAVK